MFGRGLWTPDEPREADISANMAMQADRAVPSLAGKPFLEKPPLAYWASAVATTVFPQHVAALRAPNFLYACLVTLAVAALAFSAGRLAAWIAALASGTFLLALQVASWLATDAAMMVGVTAALLGFYRGFEAPPGRAKLAWYALTHAGLAWAFLAKGPGAWLVPAVAAAGLIVFERNWRELARWELWLPLLIPASAIGAWLVWVSNGPDGAHNLAVLLWYNVAGRVVALNAPDAAAYAHAHQNWPGKYLLQLPLYIAPWSFLFLASLRRAWFDARKPDGRVWRFALCACVAPLAVLSFAGTARGIYAAPALPAAAVLIGAWFAKYHASMDRFDRAMLRATYVLVAVLAVVLLAASVFVAIAEPAARGSLFFFVVGTLTAALALVFARGYLRGGMWQPFLATSCAGFMLSVLAACSVLFPGIDRWQDDASLIAQIDRDTEGRDLDLYAPDETTVAIVDLYAPRHRGRWHIRQSVTASPAMLVLLPGHSAGPFSRALSALGIKMKSPSSGKALDAVEQQGPLRVERIYEVPEGRRYALLTSNVLSAKSR
jgi:4-amino-4-deoxy-L-arabinose transferase-like glycosyltransferase